MIELKKGTSKVDMFGKETIPLTFQANDPLKPDSFQAGYSTNFLVPFTNNNINIFEFSNTINSTSNMPYTISGFSVFSNGIEIEPQAIVQVQKVVRNLRGREGFEINLLLGNKSFFDTIKGKSLRDLDMSAYNHLYQAPVDIGMTQNNTYEDGFMYLLHKDGQLYTPTKSFNFYLRPAIFVRAIWEQIFIDAGYSQSGDFDNSVLDNLVLPHSLSDDPFFNAKRPFIDANQLSVLTTGIQDALNLAEYPPGPPNPRQYSIKYTNQIRLPYEATFTNNTTYTIQRKGKYRVKAQTIIQAEKGTSSLDVFGNLIIMQITFPETGSPDVSDGPPTFDDEPVRLYHSREPLSFNGESSINKVFSTEVLLDCVIGDEIECVVTVPPLDDGITKIDVAEDSSFEIEFVPTEIGLTFDVAENLPDISQVDFLRFFMVFFALTFQQQKFGAEVKIDYTKNIDVNNAINWTEKVDFKSYQIEFRKGTQYAQQNILEYGGEPIEGGIPFDQSNVGRGILTIPDQALEPSKVLYEAPFQKLATESNILSVVYPNWSLEGDDRTYTFARYSPEEFFPCICFLAPYNVDEAIDAQVDSFYNFYQKSTFIRRKSVFPQFLSFNIALETEWSFLQKILNPFKAFEIFAFLSEVDIQNLDFTTPVFIGGEISAYFYVSIIEQWKPNTPTKLVLYKITE